MGYYVKYNELQAAQSAIINQINQWSKELEQVKKQVQAVAQMQEIKGDTADSIKNYMQEIHLPLIQAMQNVLSQYMTKMLLYCNEYYKLDTKLNAAMRQDRLDDQILVIQTRTGAFEEIEGRVGEGVGMASGLASVSMPSGDRITNSYDQLKQDTTILMNKIGYCEYLHLNKDFKLIEDMLLGILQIIYKQSGKETVTITAYQAGSIEKTPEFHKLKEASAKQSIELNGSTEELEDAINRYAQKQQERDLADERKKEGQGQLINGILISAGAIVGAAAIIMSFGTATPVVVGACAFGMTPGLYGMSLANEGVNKVILGKEGDALTVAMNPIRDTIFASNPQLYYTIGEVSTMTITIAAPLSQTASLAMKAGTSVSKALLVEAGRTAVSGMAGTVTTNEIYKRTNNELLSALTGAAVGSISYAGMLKFDSMKNLSGYYKTSEVTNVTKNANLDTKNFVSRFGDMDEKDLIRYELFLKEGSSAGLTKAEINALKNVDEQLLVKKMDYDDILRISDQNSSKGGSKTVIYGIDDIANFKYNMIENPGPLAQMQGNPAQNFYGGRYNVEVLTEDRIYYRGGNSDKALGQWFTTESPESVAKVRIDTAVKPQWIDPVTGELTGESVVDTVYAIKIPKGTTVYTGPVGSQGGAYCGGYDMMQSFIKEPWKLDYQVISKNLLN